MAERESRQLEGQTAVIIGAQGQVADSISEAFAREGAFIYLTALDTLCLHETEARTKGTAGFDAVGVETLELDPSDEQQIKDIASTIGAKRKTVEVMVLCNVEYEQAWAVVVGFKELYGEATKVLVIQDPEMGDRSSWVKGLGPCAQLIKLANEDTMDEFDPGLIVLGSLHNET